jgi:hypothetical protein
MCYIVTKFWGMGQHHVLRWREHYRSSWAKVSVWSNTQSFEPISLSSRSSRQYHQASIVPSSSSTTPTRNLGSSYTTSTVHQSPFGGVNKWGTPVAALTFTPSLYISLQAVTSTPIYTMEVSSSSLGELKSLAEGQVPFLWRNSK